ncbi:MAG: hypothetical protein ABDH19_04620 [Thermodesulfovibrio sp.]
MKPYLNLSATLNKNQKTSQDKCTYTFDEVVNIHAKNGNTTAINSLVEKYLTRFDYEKAEKAFRKLMKLFGSIAYEGLNKFLSCYRIN